MLAGSSRGAGTLLGPAHPTRRVERGVGKLEVARSQEIISRHLPLPPAVILDVGGGPGGYSCWLAFMGYEVHLVDLVPLHLELALRASSAQGGTPVAGFTLEDARALPWGGATADAVLLMGPLYHLPRREDRLQALREARRVLKVGGVLLAVGTSRFCPLLDGLVRGLLDDPALERIVQQDLADGQHRNNTDQDYWTTAYLHLPDELGQGIEEAGLSHEGTVAVQGPVWMLGDFEEQWRDPGRRRRLLDAVRALEREHSLLGSINHFMAVARKA